MKQLFPFSPHFKELMFLQLVLMALTEHGKPAAFLKNVFYSLIFYVLCMQGVFYQRFHCVAIMGICSVMYNTCNGDSLTYS